MTSSFRIVSLFMVLIGVSLSFSESPVVLKKQNLAVMTLKSGSGMSAEEADLICDRLRGELFNTGKVNVMEREQMQTILKEQGFQQSGACTDEACMVEVGQMLGVEKIVTGSIGKLGNLFMINLRVIDVKSGQITRVVSRDVKGAIEDVVTNLGSIAAELVDGSVNKTQTIIAQNAVQPAKMEPIGEEKLESEVAATPVETIKPAAVIDDRQERNRNRGGMQMGYGMMFGRLRSQYLLESDDGYSTVTNEDTVVLAPLTLKSISLKFLIRAGQFLTVDIGSGFSWGAEETDYNTYYSTYSNDEIFYGIIPINLGLSFTKRIAPLKINAGIMGDYNFMWANYPENWPDSMSVQFGNGWSIGAKAGIELMLGSHAGIGIDFIYKYQSEVTRATYPFDDSYGYWLYDIIMTREMIMPPIGFNASFNVYF